MLSLVFGEAFEDAIGSLSRSDKDRLRIYIVPDVERVFVGHDTSDIVHVCDEACAQTVIEEEGGYVKCNGNAYVVLSHEDTANMPTIDVQAFDPGDDPFVICGACETVLHRDDDAYLTAFGRPLVWPVPEAGN